MGGTARNRFARLVNDPATQSLTIPSASRVQWLRGGASPEVEPVTFELSTDGGTIYSALGAGTRISGGWERTGLTLPASGHIRARGRTINGLFNGGGGLVETVASFGLATAVDRTIVPFVLGTLWATGQIHGTLALPFAILDPLLGFGAVAVWAWERRLPKRAASKPLNDGSTG
jgi:hypothetical protein